MERKISVIKKKEDEQNLIYFLSLSHKERLEHLEQLRTLYIKWQGAHDSKSRLQRVYTVTRRA